MNRPKYVMNRPNRMEISEVSEVSEGSEVSFFRDWLFLPAFLYYLGYKYLY